MKTFIMIQLKEADNRLGMSTKKFIWAMEVRDGRGWLRSLKWGNAMVVKIARDAEFSRIQVLNVKTYVFSRSKFSNYESGTWN